MVCVMRMDSARGETLGQGAKGRKGKTKLAILAAIATGLQFSFNLRLNARLDEAHLLIPSKKVLQKIQC